jgi:hypothetical protein
MFSLSKYSAKLSIIYFGHYEIILCFLLLSPKQNSSPDIYILQYRALNDSLVRQTIVRKRDAIVFEFPLNITFDIFSPN